jgi:hypothetical protein
MNKILSFFLLFIVLVGVKTNAQDVKSFKTVGTHDQYVPVVFAFKNKPFSISRPHIHEDREWLAYGTATISGIGFGWGSGNTKIKLENFTHGSKFSNNTGGTYSYIGNVSVEWVSNGIIVYLRGNTTYYTDGDVKRNDGTYTADAGPQTSLSAVSLDEKGFNIPPGVYVADWGITAETKSDENKQIQNNYKQKTLEVEFPNGVANQSVDILLGNHSISGWIEVTISGFFNYENSVGIIRKIIHVGAYPDNFIWYHPTSRIAEADGLLIDNIYIGDFVWDSSINQYKIPIYHTKATGNSYNIHIKQHSRTDAIVDRTTLSNIYTKSLQGNNKHQVYYNHNVGIRTNDPKHTLDVNGSFRAGNEDNQFTYNGMADVILKFKDRGNGGRAIVHDAGNILTLNYDEDFDGGTRLGRSFLVKGNNASLQGKLEAKEIKVTETPTADFVFEEDYNLPTLQTVEKHIKEKKHLPEIASAKEMEKEGVNVGEFQIKLLQKIEELTLYIIEQNKVNEKQSEQLNQLIEEINQLKKN